MTPFSLKIVTPDGLAFDGQAEELTVRTTTGDIGILAGHLNCVAPLGMGRATVVIDGQKRYAACIGGMLSVVNGAVTLVPTTFEWADKIDADRAEIVAEIGEVDEWLKGHKGYGPLGVGASIRRLIAATLVLEDRQGTNPATVAGTTSAVAQAVVEELVLILISIIVTAIVVNSIVRSGH